VTLTPRFVFGINGSIKNSLHLIDEKKLMYVAGHNIIIYNPEEQSQFFIPGTEGTEYINSITVSNKAPLLAICEKGEKVAQCTIYNLNARKKQRVIPESEYDVDYKAKEFVGAAFCPKDPNRYLVTMCSEPDWCVHLW